MRYHFMHYFEHPLAAGVHYGIQQLSDEDKIRIAKKKAVRDLAEKLLETAVFKVDSYGNVEGYVDI